MKQGQNLEWIPLNSDTRNLLNSAGLIMIDYTIGFMGIETQNRRDKSIDVDSWLIGSGVLINVGKTKGILTAYHLVNSKIFKKANAIGLILHRKGPHRFPITINCEDIVIIAKPNSDDLGPDLAFIKLKQDAIGSLEAYGKVFWNLEKRRNSILSSPVSIEIGAWVFLGYPKEKSKKTLPKEQFLSNTQLEALVTFAEIQDDGIRDGFDYLNARVPYNVDPQSQPTFKELAAEDYGILLH